MTQQKSPKFLLNALDTSVRDNLIGLALSNSNVQVTEQIDAILRKDVDELRKQGHVLIISGGNFYDLLSFEQLTYCRSN